MGRPLWREVGSVICRNQSLVEGQCQYIHNKIFTKIIKLFIQYLQGLCQSRISTADYALLLALVPLAVYRDYSSILKSPGAELPVVKRVVIRNMPATPTYMVPPSLARHPRGPVRGDSDPQSFTSGVPPLSL
jgi:hypothetical protein